MMPPGARVLDIGCGDGALLRLLAEKRNVDGRGIELSQADVNACVAHGLSVIQGDADTDLVDYPDSAFDYAILSQTIQATRQPPPRAGAAAAHRQKGDRLLPQFRPLADTNGATFPSARMPRNDTLPDRWYDTPNIHLCTIKDFVALCDDVGARVEKAVALNAYGYKLGVSMPFFMQNLFGQQAVFLLSR